MEHASEIAIVETSIGFEDLFAAERDRLFAALWLVTRDRHEAEDVAQDAFVRVWERWERRGAPDDPVAYLFRTAMNLVRNRRRRAAVALRRAPRPDHGPDGLDAVETQDLVLRALGTLTERERAAIVLIDLLDMTSDDAGAALGIRSSTARVLAWALDDSGRREVLARSAGYALRDTGRFGPGDFPDEGDLSAFPTDPDALEAFLLDRSADDGASPRPDVTPAPGVPLEQGLLWNAIRDHLGSTQYLNATPELRAAMLRVLATVPMVQVSEGAVDPLGRPAVVLRFSAYGGAQEVFVDPRTGDFLAHVERYTEPVATDGSDGSDGSGDGTPMVRVTLVEEAGFTGTDDERPRADDRTVAFA